MAERTPLASTIESLVRILIPFMAPRTLEVIGGCQAVPETRTCPYRCEVGLCERAARPFVHRLAGRRVIRSRPWRCRAVTRSPFVEGLEVALHASTPMRTLAAGANVNVGNRCEVFAA
jgi:hypothetical protein